VSNFSVIFLFFISSFLEVKISFKTDFIENVSTFAVLLISVKDLNAQIISLDLFVSSITS
jgi:hypothetical protein